MQKWARDTVEDKPLPRYVNDNDFVVADALRGCKIRANDRRGEYGSPSNEKLDPYVACVEATT